MDFLKDELGRQKFADVLSNYLVTLSSVAVLPAGRVLAIDAPWGSGKSWIAKRLPGYLKDDKRIGKCIYIDAFQFDYHQDPFSVLTSAILDAYKDETKEVSSLKSAAKKVLKASAPAIAKGVLNVGFKAIGIDAESISASIAEGTSNTTEKALEAMLSTVSKTSAANDAFKQKLSHLATVGCNGAPLVVVIDELDRCRPSYALELLERVKHLFDVPNVVFALFVHTPALHSAIRKTYGYEIDSSEYLRKFISVTIGIPVSDTSSYSTSERTSFVRRFVQAQYPVPPQGISRDEDAFRESLIAFTPAFNASFRDIENAMLLWQLIAGRSRADHLFSAYVLMLKIKDPLQLPRLRSEPSGFFTREISRLASPDENQHSYVDYMRAVVEYGLNKLKYDSDATLWRSMVPLKESQQGLRDFSRAISGLDLEYLRL